MPLDLEPPGRNVTTFDPTLLRSVERFHRLDREPGARTDEPAATPSASQPIRARSRALNPQNP